MHKEELELHIRRAEKFLEKLPTLWSRESVLFEATFNRSDEPVPFAERLTNDRSDGWKPISEGESWGKEWDSAWFHLTARVPEAWKGSALAAYLDFSGEALLFDGEGNALQGLSDSSVFWSDYTRLWRPLAKSCDGGEEISLIVEASASNLMGIEKEQDPRRHAPKRHGHYDGKVRQLKLCRFSPEYFQFTMDFACLYRLMIGLPAESVRRARILRTLGKAMDAHYGPEDISACRTILAEALNQPARESDLKAVSVGHAHIDTAWLWPIRESIRKCGRTFSSQLDLMERYPEYIFGASQPQHYEFTKKHYPDLYERIKARVKEGRWELQGGMWVEADCNVISGESMVRQFLHGKNFYRDEFGEDVRNLWIPDVFGYSAAMPQIMKKCGVDFFLTQKISWSQFNKFPHHTFTWRGIDGSEVLTHFPPEDTYNSNLFADSLRKAGEKFGEKAFLDEFMVLFGVGDGGGGPKAEQIEAGLRQGNLEGTPQVVFGRADDFFDRLAERKEELSVWSGELYLEYHRGTLTTQALVKKRNRLMEQRLRRVEFLYSLFDLAGYPSEKLDRIWKDMLCLHFHDIIPGSSINRVYKDAHATYEKLFSELDELEQALLTPDENVITLVNILSHEYSEPVELPLSWEGCEILDGEGRSLEVQKTGSRLYLNAPLPPMSLTRIQKGAPKSVSTEKSALVLENGLVRYTFDEKGRMTGCFDKEMNREMMAGPGNVFSLFEDVPNQYDAWDVDIFYENQKMAEGVLTGWEGLEKGPVSQGLRFTFTVGESRLTQEIVLPEDSPMIRFHTHADWREMHKMLRVSFPVDVRADQASYDIQYGTVKRNTHRNTSWDMAKFEAAAHKFVDLSCEDYGAALLNDCKYGYKVHENVLDLNLLRSPNYPDPDADYGEHEFTYAFMPHRGRLEESSVYQAGAMLNQKPYCAAGELMGKIAVPCTFDSKVISLEVVKKSEKDDSLVLRFVELRGKNSSGTLMLNGGNRSIAETDMMEWNLLGDRIEGKDEVEISLKPFEIRTYRLWQR